MVGGRLPSSAFFDLSSMLAPLFGLCCVVLCCRSSKTLSDKLLALSVRKMFQDADKKVAETPVEPIKAMTEAWDNARRANLGRGH